MTRSEGERRMAALEAQRNDCAKRLERGDLTRDERWRLIVLGSNLQNEGATLRHLLSAVD
jgi:hypothetical protein